MGKEGKLERDSGCGMAVAGGWADVSVRVTVELRPPPRAWGMSQQLHQLLSLFAHQAHLGFYFFASSGRWERSVGRVWGS